MREQNRENKEQCTDWHQEKLFIVSLQMWLLRHRRAAALLRRSGSMLHFLTCQCGQAKHRTFWHRHFTSVILTDTSNREQPWRRVIPSGPPQLPVLCLQLERKISPVDDSVVTPRYTERKNAARKSCPCCWLFFDETRDQNVNFFLYFGESSEVVLYDCSDKQKKQERLEADLHPF